MPTTSQPPRRSKSKAVGAGQGSPIKGIEFSVTLSGAGTADFRRLAAEKGLKVREEGAGVTVAVSAPSPEKALAQLGLLADLLSRKA